MEDSLKQPNRGLKDAVAHCAALALFRLFPKSKLLSVSATDLGFTCRVSLSKAARAAPLEVLEEAMRAVCMEDLPFVFSEMLAENAAEMLRAKRLSYEAQRAEGCRGILLDVAQLGECYQLVPQHAVERSSRCKHFQILSWQQVDEELLLEGVCAEDSSTLKKMLKALKKRPQWDSSVLLEQRGWAKCIAAGEWLILPPFSHLCKELLDCPIPDCEEVVLDGAVPVEFLKDVSLCGEVVSAQESDPLLFDGVKRKKRCHEKIVLSDLSEKKLISHLQFLTDLIRMLPLKGEWVLQFYGKNSKKVQNLRKPAESALISAFSACKTPLDRSNEDSFDLRFCGPRAEYIVRDRLGREWKTAQIGIQLPELSSSESRRNKSLLKLSLFGSVERFAALLMEEGEGKLPQKGFLATRRSTHDS